MSRSSLSEGPLRSFKPQFASNRPAGYRTPSPPLQSIEPLSPAPPTRFSAQPPPPTAAPQLYSRHLNDITYPTFAIHDQYDRPSEPHASIVKSRHSHIPTSSAQQHGASPLDALAILATSPSLVDSATFAFPNLHRQEDLLPTWKYPTHDLPRGGHHRHVSDTHYERPSKRHRADGSNGQLAPTSDTRPATSHAHGSGQMNGRLAGGEIGLGHPTDFDSERIGQNARPQSSRATEQEAELLLGLRQGFRDNTSSESGKQEDSVSNGTTYRLENHILLPGPHIGASRDQEIQYDGQWKHSSAIQRPPHGRSYNQAFTHIASLPDPHANRTHYDATANDINDQSLRRTALDMHDILDSSPEHPPTSKPRVYKGWPKGKPRGPRNSTGDSKKAKKSAAKKESSANQDSKVDRLTQTLPASHVQDNPVDVSWDAPNVAGATTNGSLPHDNHHGDVRMSNGLPGDATADHNEVAVAESIQTNSNKPHLAQKEEITICPACQMTRDESKSDHDTWIGCNGCKEWFHTSCAGFENEQKVKDVDKFFCKGCEPTYGPSTFVRKSARAHASIDYAGLNEGKVRAAEDVTEHHYIKPIKEGTLQLQQETFPRMPPELVTAEYFERCGTMSEPIVIPAALNKRMDDQDGDFTCPAGSESHLAESTSQKISMNDAFLEDLDYDCVREDGQDKLDMVIPKGLTVRRVAELYGPEEKVEVIDVKSQEGEMKKWNMRQWADYYEQDGDKPVRNVISLEVSQSRLGRLIRRPKIVRDIDLQDSVWPSDETAKGIYPKVQFYCLMSVADSYTDFHIDFGGSSVYYHIIKGRKTFFFIPPKPKYLKKYEEWCLSPEQNNIWLGSLTNECYQVDLYPGDTMLIPSGWIHSVWTPENSLVIGGNFLTRMHYGMQIQINDIEKNTGVARKFRYPYFQKVLWQAVIQYLEKDKVPSTVAEKLWNGEKFERATPVYHDFDLDPVQDEVEPEFFNARYYSKGELEGLPDLLKYIHRTVIVGGGKASGVPKTVQEAVIRSMPKGHGDHTEILKVFAIWVAWKRGNELLPSWAYPDAEATESDFAATATDKKRGEKGSKRGNRDGSLIPPERRSQRQQPADSLATSTGTASGDPADVLPVGSEQIAKQNTVENNGDRKAALLGNFGIRRVMTYKREQSTPSVNGDNLTSNTTWSNVQLPAPQAIMTTSYATNGSSETEYSKHILTKPAADLETTSHSPIHENAKFSIIDGQLSSAKGSRGKACPECRKSKRRCIHDKNGEIDPIKASEAPVPRGPRVAKRPRQSDGAEELGSKRTRSDSSGVNFDQSNPEEPVSTPSKLPSDAPQTDIWYTTASPQKIITGVMDKSHDALSILETLQDGLGDGTQEMSDSVQIPDNGTGEIADAEGSRPPQVTSEIERSQEYTSDMHHVTEGSRTPSTHVQSASTEGADTYNSDRRSSPLTEPDATSPSTLDQGNAEHLPEVETGGRYTPRDRKQTVRYGVPDYQSASPSVSSTAKKSRTSSATAAASPSRQRASARNSRSMSHEHNGMPPTFASQLKLHAKGMDSAIAEEDEEIDPSLRLARELAAQDHGLRRRS